MHTHAHMRTALCCMLLPSYFALEHPILTTSELELSREIFTGDHILSQLINGCILPSGSSSIKMTCVTKRIQRQGVQMVAIEEDYLQLVANPPPPPPLPSSHPPSLAIIMMETLTHESPFYEYLDYVEVDEVLDAIAGRKIISAQLPQVFVCVCVTVCACMCVCVGGLDRCMGSLTHELDFFFMKFRDKNLHTLQLQIRPHWSS